MITSIRIQNFKAILDSGWIDIKNLNVIMGANSSGKSSIGKALLFMKNIFQNENRNTSEFPYYIPLDIDENDGGTFGTTVHDGKKEFKIGFNLNFSLNTQSKLKELRPWIFRGAFVIEFTFTGKMKNYDCILASIEYRDFKNNETLVMIKNKEESFRIEVNQSGLFNSGLNKKSIINYLRGIKAVPAHKKNEFIEAINPVNKLLDISSLPSIKFDISKENEEEEFQFMRLARLTQMVISEQKKRNYARVEKEISPTFSSAQDSSIKIPGIDYQRLTNNLIRKEVKLHPYVAMQLGKYGPNIDDNDNDAAIFIKTYLHKFDTANFLGDIMQHLNAELSFFIRGIIHVGPQRHHDMREIKTRGKKTDNIWSKLYNDKSARQKLSYVILTLGNEKIKDIRFKDIHGKHFSVEVKGVSGKWRNIMDIGFGFGQLLPVLLGCVENAFVKKRNMRIQTESGKRPMLYNLLIIEEPEVHLHPRLAASLAHFFNQVHKDFGARIIIETHSEHYILKNQSEIKKDPQLADATQILFMERIHSQGKSFSQITPVSFKKDGQLNKKFPDDFFDISHNLYMELLK